MNKCFLTLVAAMTLLGSLMAEMFAADGQPAGAPVKVACVGNSVTYGFGIEDREVNSYPAQLQRLLGDGYEVRNFGRSGATLSRNGHRPYHLTEEYQQAMAFAADKVVIHLGLNDTDPRNWPNYRDQFVSDYLTLINAFREVNPDCEIWVCRMTPIFHGHSRFKSGTRDWFWQIQRKIEAVAASAHTGLIDFHPRLYQRPDLMPDNLHPNAEGAGFLAQAVYGHLTGDFGGLRLPITYSDNMVLQRGKPLRIAGQANARETVTVKVAGEKAKTVAAADGQWTVTLPPLKAGGPYTLEINAASGKKTYKNVLVGEVWLCSGQSNMAFRVDQSVKEELEASLRHAATSPQIRLFDMQPRWYTNDVEWETSVLDSLNRLQYYADTQWTACNEQTVKGFSAVAYAFGKMLADSLGVPIGLIHNSVGGAPTEAWIDRKTVEFAFPDILYNWAKNDFVQDWVRGRGAKNIAKATNKVQRHPYQPCYLYEAGIAPLGQFPLRGFIWYQGESNAHNLEAHERLFQLLADSWRKNWQEELPLYYVQLSSLNRPSWTWFRDSQRRLMTQVPQVGMAVSSDRGDSLNVHPCQKREVGERLALWALNRTYGHACVPSGPLFTALQTEGNVAYLSFDYAEGLHSADGAPLRTFEVAEEEDRYVPAQAEVVGNQVKVWSEEVRHPRYIRYGWQPFTRANLVNGAGLPASTFQCGE